MKLATFRYAEPTVGEGVTETLAALLRETVPEGEAEAVMLGETLPVGVVVALPVKLRLPLREALTVPELLLLGESDSVGEALSEPLPLPESVALAVAEPEAATLGVLLLESVVEALAVTLQLPLREAVLGVECLAQRVRRARAELALVEDLRAGGERPLDRAEPVRGGRVLAAGLVVPDRAAERVAPAVEHGHAAGSCRFGTRQVAMPATTAAPAMVSPSSAVICPSCAAVTAAAAAADPAATSALAMRARFIGFTLRSVKFSGRT